jgi:hypothetical protein
MFKPGESGNLAGRPKKPFVYSDTLREYCNKTLQELEDMFVNRLTMIQRIVRQDLIQAMTAEDSQRIRASEMVQDRLEGKPQQSISTEINDVTENPIVTALRQMRE